MACAQVSAVPCISSSMCARKCIWAAFIHHRQDITSRNHRLRDGLRLFEAAISLEIVYVAGAWSGLEDVAKASPINTDEPETHHELQKDVQKKNKKGVCEEDVKDETKKGSQHTWNYLEL